MKRVLIPLLLLVSQIAWAGNELGNGGDSYAQEFAALGRKIVQQLKKNPDPRILDVEGFEKAVEKTKISTKDKLQLGDAEVDAINYPEDYRIELHRGRWQVASSEQKVALVLHEYLGITKIDDHNYQVSSTYTEVAMEGLVKPVKLELQLRSGYSRQASISFEYGRWSTRPDLGGSASYRLNQNWAVGVGVDSYLYGSQSVMKYSAFGKYTFLAYKKLKPFVSLGAAYVRTSYTYDAWYGSGDYGFKMVYDNDKGSLVADGGAGFDYEFSRSFNLGISLRIAGLPLRSYSRMITSAALGTTFLF